MMNNSESVSLLKYTSYIYSGDIKVNKMLSYRRETALQGALQFSPKVEDWNWENILRTL